MQTRPLILAWCLLMALSVIGTALSLLGTGLTSPVPVALGILAVAWAKARLILLHYLGLASVPQWRGGMMTATTFATLLFAGLWLAGHFTAL